MHFVSAALASLLLLAAAAACCAAHVMKVYVSSLARRSLDSIHKLCAAVLDPHPLALLVCKPWLCCNNCKT